MFTNRKKDAVKSPSPLRPRLDFAVKHIERLVQKLDQADDKFSQREKATLARVLDAYTKHDTAHACVFANELAESRKISILIINSKSALEQIAFRLQTVKESGDSISTVGIALRVLQTVKSGLGRVFPEAENELNEIENTLSGMMSEADKSSEMTLNSGTVNKEADKILTEAATVAKQRSKEKIPESCKFY
jgi:division protein CdvB (Snf7/Vps24/ESCRT-III family)